MVRQGKRQALMPHARVDLTGKRFDRLKVLAYAGYLAGSGTLWECLCDCGTKKVVSKKNLVSGNTRSCGCYKKRNTQRYLMTSSTRFLLTSRREDNVSE